VGHTDVIGQSTWNADDTKLVSAAQNSSVIVWDTLKGSQLQKLSYDPPISLDSVEWMPDEKYILTGGIEGGPSLIVWDADTGKLISEHYLGALGDMVWSPDQTRLVASGVRVVIISGTSFELITAYSDRADGNADIIITAVNWQPTGNYIASGNALGTIRLRDPKNGDIVREFHASDKLESFVVSTLVRTLRFSPDGARLQSVTTDGTVRMWDVETGRLIEESDLGTLVSAAAWSPYLGRIAYSPMEMVSQDPVSGFAEFAGSGEIRILVPNPSLEKVNRLAQTCLSAAPEKSEGVTQILNTNTLTLQALPQFITDLNNLPAGAIPEGCASDLIAVAEAVIEQS
jgi:hypothetical protein